MVNAPASADGRPKAFQVPYITGYHLPPYSLNTSEISAGPYQDTDVFSSFGKGVNDTASDKSACACYKVHLPPSVFQNRFNSRNRF